MEVNEIINKIEPIIEKSNFTFFFEVLSYLKSKYINISKGVNISDFSVSNGFQSITLTKENDYLNIELHKDYLEVNIGGYFLFFLSKEEYSKEIVYSFLEGCLNGKYLLKIRKNQKNKIIFSSIDWEDTKLSIFNREEKKSLLNVSVESETILLGINYLEVIHDEMSKD